MTESDRKKIAELLQGGMPLTQVRQMMAMRYTEFEKEIAEMRENGELPKRKLGREKVAEAFARGERDIQKIADMYGLTYGTVKYYKTALGIKVGKRPKRNYKHCARTNAIIQDLKDGELTTAEIARKNGVKWQSVHTIKKKLQEDGEL